MKKLLAASVLALTFVAGPVVAQTTQSTNPTTNERGNTFKSDDEKAFYDNKGWSAFFTDDSMGTMKSEAEMKSAWSAASDQDRSDMKASCDKVNNNKGSYGTVTAGLCAQVGMY